MICLSRFFPFLLAVELSPVSQAYCDPQDENEGDDHRISEELEIGKGEHERRHDGER